MTKQRLFTISGNSGSQNYQAAGLKENKPCLSVQCSMLPSSVLGAKLMKRFKKQLEKFLEKEPSRPFRHESPNTLIGLGSLEVSGERRICHSRHLSLVL